MREWNIERTDALRRFGIAVLLVVSAAAALMPGAATAAGGSLTSGDYTGPAGTQHYQLYVPSSYKADTPMPLVVAMHGCTQSADQFRLLSRWDVLAEQKGFIVVFPQQDPKSNTFKCWDFFQDAHMHRSGGEPMRIAGLTEWVENNYAVDTQRVYGAGFSAGGAMASVMAATYPDVYAAIGIGSGCEYAATPTCAGYKSADPAQAAQQAYKEMGSHARSMPFISFQGDQDTVVPPANADQLVQQWLATDDLADDGSLNGSVKSQAAKTSFGFTSAGESYTTRSYLDAHKAELAQYWVIHGMKHAWSGGDASQQYSDPAGPDETAAMYAFFVGHTAPLHPRAVPLLPPPAPTATAAPAAGSPSASARTAALTVSKPKRSGRRIVFTVSGPGKVTLLLQKRTAGHKYRTRARIVRRAAKAGRMVVKLPRKVHGHRLSRGRYRVIVTPTDSAGHAGQSHMVRFVLR